MPARDIAAANEVWLGDTYFKLRGPVRRTNITVTPNPVVFGDTSKVTDTQFMSQFIQSHSLGGSGILRGSVRTDFDRHWKSRADTRFRYTCLPPRVVTGAAPDEADPLVDPTLLIEFQGLFFTVYTDEVYAYDPRAEDWSPNIPGTVGTEIQHTLADSPALDAAVYQIPGGDTYIVISYGSGYAYWNGNPGSSWVADTDDAALLCEFDGKLWTLRSDRTLHYTTNLTTWSASATSVPYQATPTALFVFRDAAGTQKLYLSSDRGLFILDQTNAKWLTSDVRYPAYQDAGAHPVVFRDAKAYLKTGGLSMISVESGSTMVITPMGLDRDDGVDSSETGEIVSLGFDYNWIWALIQGSTDNGDSASEVGSMLPGSNLGAMGWYPWGGYTTVRAWNGGWHCLWESGSEEGLPTALCTSSSDGQFRVVWMSDRVPHMITLPFGLYNPRQNPSWEFQAGPVSHITPWWDLSSEMQEKNVAHVPVYVTGASSTEKVTVYYGTDLSESWTSLGEITSDGLSVLKIASGAGVKARLFRFRFDLERGSDVNASPIVEFYAAEFMKLLPATYGYVMEIDTSDPYRGKTPDQQMEALNRLSDPSQTTTLIEFTYQDDLSGTARTHYARISRFQAAEYTGRKERGKGTVMLSVIVPYSSDSL